MKNTNNLHKTANKINKILLFKIGAIGDTLMTTPLIRQLRMDYPYAKIDYLIGSISSHVLEGTKYIDEIIKFDETIFFKKNLIEWKNLIKKIKQRKYDVVFVLDKHWIFNLTAKLFGIKERIGFNRMGREGKFLTKKAKYNNEKHEIFYYLDLLKAFGGETNYDDWKTDLFLEKNDERFAETEFKINKLNSKTIAIAPGGGKNAGEATGIRNMDIEKYVELIRQLLLKYNIILIGNTHDKEKEEKILNSIDITPYKKKIISFIGKSKIKETAALIKKCEYFICNDSGAMHIGGAVNNRIISVFGPTNPARKAPLWKESTAIWKDQDIYEPEYELYGRQPSKEKRFFTKITTEDILKCIKQIN